MAEPNITKHRALVVEDDSAIRTLAARILTREGFDVDEAPNGREALARLSGEDAFEVIVLDLAMPQMNGIEVIDYVRSHFPRLLPRIVIITANVRLMRKVMPEGVCHMLLKPFDISDFLAIVRACAGRSDS